MQRVGSGKSNSVSCFVLREPSKFAPVVSRSFLAAISEAAKIVWLPPRVATVADLIGTTLLVNATGDRVVEALEGSGVGAGVTE
jgi:hypothetical protein